MTVHAMATRLTREEVTRELGDLDDATIAEVISSGADAEELARAVHVVRDGELLPVDATASRQRVMDLCDVIAPLARDPDPDESGEYPATD
jgi:hypothetical protein